MKTLDEVIKRIEIYKNIFDKDGCFECHYHEDDCIDSCFLENVLYYLNTIETTENLYHDTVNELSKWKEEDWKDKCLPLTWDELRQMEGKPVWVEFLKDGESYDAEWIIIQDINDECMGDTQRFTYQKLDYSDKWQAYRKERS